MSQRISALQIILLFWSLLVACDRPRPVHGQVEELTGPAEQALREAASVATAGLGGDVFSFDAGSLKAWKCDRCPESAFAEPERARRQPDPERGGSPYFVVKSDDPETDRLPLKSTRADVSIAGNVAEVRVTQVYKNKGKNVIEAVYTFPASTRAAVHAMRMTIGKRVIEARIEKREKARRDYENARAAGQTASLLEQQRPNVFTMNVANILPKDVIKVEMIYSELLVPEDDVYEFVYPTVVGPRFVDKRNNSETWTATPYHRKGDKPIHTFGLHASIRAPLPISCLGSHTHQVSTFMSNDAAAVVTLDESVSAGDRDFILRYSLTSDKIQSGVLLYQGRDENMFMLLASPPRNVSGQQVLAREYIFVVDVSGSMAGFPLDVSRTLLSGLLGSLRKQDRFNILLFAAGSQLMAETSVPATRENLNKASQLMSSWRGGGGTRLSEALRRAIGLPDANGASRVLVVITDGYVAADRQCITLIRDNLNKASVFAYGIGKGVNRYVIEGLAHAGAGQPFVVTDPAEAEQQLPRFRRYVEAPVMRDLRVSFEGFDAYDVQPEHVPAVFAGRPVVVLGKFRGRPSGNVAMSGQTADGKYETRFDVARLAAPKQTRALQYLWARETIRNLSDFGDPTHVDPWVEEEVTALGLKYNLLTRFTSFVAVDSRVRADGRPVTVKQPLPLPQGVPESAIGGMGSRIGIGVGYGGLAMMGTGRGGGDARMRRAPRASAPSSARIAAPPARVRTGAVTVRGSLSTELIRRIVRRHLNEIRFCYEQQLGAHPSLKGVVTVRFIISPTGAVHSAAVTRSTLNNAALEQCVVKAVKRWTFHAPEGGGTVVVTYPFEFGGST